jgi:putative membrane protein
MDVAGLSRREPLFLLLATFLALAVSAIHPDDMLTWWMETAPVFIAIPLLVWTAKSFPLTPLLYRLIFLHALVLIVGGHYTYAKVPLGFWLQDVFDFQRNHYDRIGHFMQGFEPAILAREIFIRKKVVQGKWLLLFVLSVCLAFSACYEFIEWFAALVNSQASESFLGTQGDVWDTQWDMFMCLIGAVTALMTLQWLHDRQLAELADASAKVPPVLH